MNKTDLSYGIIPLRKIEGNWEVFLIKHNVGHWAFPKGHAEGNEPPIDAAQRELEEETGLSIKNFISRDPLEENYSFVHEKQKIIKTVYYYIAEVEGVVKLQVEEVSDGQWIAIEKAGERVTFVEGRKLCDKICRRLK